MKKISLGVAALAAFALATIIVYRGDSAATSTPDYYVRFIAPAFAFLVLGWWLSRRATK
jgi:hypothetical protein